MSKNQNEDKEPKNSEFFRAISYFSQIGVTMAATVFISVLLGKYLDGLLGTKPWFILIISLLGVGASIKTLFNMSYDKK